MGFIQIMQEAATLDYNQRQILIRMLSEDKNVLPVKDGYVSMESEVWWHSNCGPEKVIASGHWRNIRSFPTLYSLEKPGYTVTYKD